MTRIADLLAAGRTCSFEFFPPKTDEAARSLEKTVAELEVLHPSFVSVTYGAGGSTRERTRDIVIHIERDTGITAMAHLTCMGHTVEQLTSLFDEYRDAGISNLLALAGDPPADAPDAFDTGDFLLRPRAGRAHPGARRLLRGRRRPSRRPPTLVRRDAPTVGTWPPSSRPPTSPSPSSSSRPSPTCRWSTTWRRSAAPSRCIPGIMPVTNAGQVARFAELAGAEFPPHLAARFDAVADDPEAVRALGVQLATELCERLLAEGVPGLHFYTLNRSTATRDIAANLGLDRPA